MKIAIVQLSDIHIRGASDIANQYLSNISKIFHEISCPNVEGIVIVLCGDLVYSGKSEEYTALKPSLMRLRDNIVKDTKIIPQFIVMPGNHDCDFALDNALRKWVIESSPQDTHIDTDASIVDQCVKVQGPFWQFAHDTMFLQPTADLDHMYLEYNFTFADKELKLRCYNTAWVSQIHEKPGQMDFPKRYFADHDLELRSDVAVSLLHHPTNWLTPERKREFDIVLDRSSDLLIFGHEHLPQEYIKGDLDGNKTKYIYGGVFQTTSPECPGHFNVIFVNFETSSYQIRHFERKGANFIRNENTDEWISLGHPTYESLHGFRLSQTQAEYLEDPEIEFAHRSGRRLLLDDIYITPDFTSFSALRVESDNESGKLVKGEQFDEILRTKRKIIILGQDRSGRTTLAKKIFRALFRDGVIPVLVRGEQIKSGSIEHIDKLIRIAMQDAYLNPDLSVFDQLDLTQRALIIDGFEKAKLTAKTRSQLLKELESKFDSVIIFGNPLMMVEEVAGGVILEDALPTFVRLEIRELGRAARRRLISRWQSISDISDVEELKFRIADAEGVINTLLGKSFLPAYPIFILSFLQSIESSRPMDNIGSYGFHYEAFITNALSRHYSTVSLDIQYQFLSELAYLYYKDNVSTIDEVSFGRFYVNYSEKYGISPDQQRLRQSLLDSRLLEHRENLYRFKYPYAYYFFVARYFRDHIDEESIRVSIRTLCQNFHIEQNANIWMFLAHLSKSQFLLTAITEEAKAIFSEFPALKLDHDVQYLRDIGDTVPALTLPNSRPDDNIEQHYQELDKLDEAERNEVPPSEPELRDIFTRINAMIRTVQIMGQLLKNFPGSLTAVEKYGIVENSFNLGLRGLSFIIRSFEAGRDEYIEMVSTRLAKRYGADANSEQLKSKVRSALFWLLRMSIVGTLKFISHGVGAKGEESTYQKVVEGMNTNAAKLLEVSIGLDTLRIPRKRILELHAEFADDVLNKHLLASLVTRHLYLFDVPNNIKDELCKRLEISVQQIDRVSAASGDHTKRV